MNRVALESSFEEPYLSRDHVSWRTRVSRYITRSGLAYSPPSSVLSRFISGRAATLRLLHSSLSFAEYPCRTMARHPGKRKSDVVDLTTDGASTRAPKTTRTESSQTASTDQRFGEPTDFIPLNQLSQVDGADDEDAQAAEVVQGSQESGENSMVNSTLYGMRSFSCRSVWILRRARGAYHSY